MGCRIAFLSLSEIISSTTESGTNCNKAFRPIFRVSTNFTKLVSEMVKGRVANLNILLKSLIFNGVFPVKSIFFSEQATKKRKLAKTIPLRMY